MRKLIGTTTLAVTLQGAYGVSGPHEWANSLMGLVDTPDRESLIELLTAVDHSARNKQKVTGSFERRRWPEDKNVCEDSNPPDTTTDECFKKRYQEMQGYMEGHRDLVRTDRKLVMGEWETEGVMGKAINELEKDIDLLYGYNGAVGKPSSTEGLIRESKILSDATSQLQGASVASLSIMYDQVLNMSDIASATVKTLKGNLAASLSDLMGKVDKVSNKQATRAGNNTDQMLKDANKQLTSSTKAVDAAQRIAAGTVAAASTHNEKNSQTFTKSATGVQNGLSDADDLIEAAGEGVDAQTQTAVDTLTQQIGTAAESLSDSGSSKAEDVAAQAEQIADKVKQEHSDQLGAAKDQWSGATADAALQAKAIADSTSAKIDGVGDAINAKLEGASTNATDKIKSTQGTIETRTADAQKVTQDVSTGIASLSTNIRGGVSSTSSQANQLGSDAEAGAQSASKKIGDLIKSASAASGKSIQDILGSLGAAQMDAKKNSAMTEEESQAAIAKFLEQIGNDGSKIAGAMSSLSQMVSSSKAKAESEINASFGQTDAQAAQAKTQLTGQLDQAGNQLSETEKKFADGTKTLQNQMQNQLKGGTSATAGEISSFEKDKKALASKLSGSIMNAMAAFTGSSEDMDRALKDLKEMLKTLVGESGSAKDAIGGTSSSIDENIASLMASLAESDDGTADKMGAQVGTEKKGLNKFGQNFAGKSGAEMAAIWARVSQQLHQREGDADKAAIDAESSEQNTMDKAERLRDLAKQMLGDTDSLVQEGESKGKLAANEFAARLAQMSSKDNGVAGNLQGLLNGYIGEASGDVGDFLSSVIGRKNRDIGRSLQKERDELKTMGESSTETSSDAVRLDSIIGALRRDSQSSRDGLINGILGLLDETQSSQDSFEGRIERAAYQLYHVRTASAESLRDMTQSIQKEVLKIPMILTGGAVRMQNDFKLASSDLQNNINKLKEKLATAQTEEEREEAMQGLVVLEKLNGLQQGVLDADTKLRSDIQANAQEGKIDSGNVEGAMAGVLAAMTTINSQMDSSKVAVQSDTEMVGKQTATLVNGLNMMINGTTDRLSHEAAQAAVDARFNLNMADARNKVRIAAASQGVGKAMKTFNTDNGKVFDNEGKVRKDIDQMKDVTRGASMSLGQRIDAVLDAVTNQSDSIKSDSVQAEGDIITRLALVRMAMANFLGLWNEYAANMDRKFKRFHSSDTEFISQMERELRAKLGYSEAKVNMTDARIVDLRKEIESGMKDEVEFENFFTSKLNDLKSDIKHMNDERNVKTIKTNAMLNEFENFEHDNYGKTKDGIKRMIDNFDDKMAGRAGQMDAWTVPASSSFIEEQIKELDREAVEVL